MAKWNKHPYQNQVKDSGRGHGWRGRGGRGGGVRGQGRGHHNYRGVGGVRQDRGRGGAGRGAFHHRGYAQHPPRPRQRPRDRDRDRDRDRPAQNKQNRQSHREDNSKAGKVHKGDKVKKVKKAERAASSSSSSCSSSEIVWVSENSSESQDDSWVSTSSDENQPPCSPFERDNRRKRRREEREAQRPKRHKVNPFDPKFVERPLQPAKLQLTERLDGDAIVTPVAESPVKLPPAPGNAQDAQTQNQPDQPDQPAGYAERIVFGCMKRINHEISPVIELDPAIADWYQQIQDRNLTFDLDNFQTLLEIGIEAVTLAKVHTCRENPGYEKYVRHILDEVEAAYIVLRDELDQDFGPGGLDTLRVRPSPSGFLQVTSAVSPDQTGAPERPDPLARPQPRLTQQKDELGDPPQSAPVPPVSIWKPSSWTGLDFAPQDNLRPQLPPTHTRTTYSSRQPSPPPIQPVLPPATQRQPQGESLDDLLTPTPNRRVYPAVAPPSTQIPREEKSLDELLTPSSRPRPHFLQAPHAKSSHQEQSLDELRVPAKSGPYSVLPLAYFGVQIPTRQSEYTRIGAPPVLNGVNRPKALPQLSDRNIFRHIDKHHSRWPYRLPANLALNRLVHTRYETEQIYKNLQRFQEQNKAVKQKQDPPNPPLTVAPSITGTPLPRQDTVASAPAVAIPLIEAEGHQATPADQQVHQATSARYHTKPVTFSIVIQQVAETRPTPAAPVLVTPAPPAPPPPPPPTPTTPAPRTPAPRTPAPRTPAPRNPVAAPRIPALPASASRALKMASSKSILQRFLAVLDNDINTGNGDALQKLLPIEPPFNSDYIHMLEEIRLSFSDPQDLQEFIRDRINVSGGDDPDAWYAFPDFIVNYFNFIRDVNVENLLETYEMLSNLITKTSGVLQNDPYGILILPTALEYSKVLARLAIGLDQQPHLIAHLATSEDDPMSLPERAVMNLRGILGVCTRDSRENGKGTAVYKIANLCLKILFQCNKVESTTHILNLVMTQPRPLDTYPRSERVTYLYYLGRYYFSVTRFYSALLCLEAAYTECHLQYLKQRRLILIYLTTTNIILGRFPTSSLYKRPEAKDFQPRFEPICRAIAKGDIASFRIHTRIDSEHSDWLLYFGVLLPLSERCEPLVWRSLARRVYSLYDAAAATADPTAMPTLTLEALQHIARGLEIRALSPLARAEPAPGKRALGWIFIDTSQPPPAESAYIDPDFAGLDADEAAPQILLPDLEEVECIVAGLVESGLMNGFVSQRQSKFAIAGAKKKPVLEAGWPQVWETLTARRRNARVHGWKREYGAATGMEIRMNSAAPAGG